MIKFVLDTLTLGLEIKLTVKDNKLSCNIVVYSDSDRAGDRDNHYSISGYGLFCLQYLPSLCVLEIEAAEVGCSLLE